MATNLANSINRLQTNVSDALAAIAEKGVDVTGADSDDLAALIALISGGGGYTNGEFTVAATSSGEAEDVTVTHNLGKIPNIAVAINSSLAPQQVAYGSILVYAYIDGVSYSAVSKSSNASITVTKSTRADITAANTGFGSATEESVVFKKGGSGYSSAKTYYYILGAI